MTVWRFFLMLAMLEGCSSDHRTAVATLRARECPPPPAHPLVDAAREDARAETLLRSGAPHLPFFLHPPTP